MTSVTHLVAGIMASLIVVSEATAQDVADAEPLVMDTVVVVPFHVEDSGLRTAADDARVLVETALQDTFVVVAMSDVEGFAKGYDAYSYMRACPPGQYLGCSFVVGGKADVQWTVAAVVSGSSSSLDIELSIMDIDNTELALTVDLTLDESSKAVFGEGMTAIMSRVVAGAAASADVRGEITDEKASLLELKRQAEETAAGLEAMEFELGDVERLEIERIERLSRLSRGDLDEMEAREGGAPWEQLEMSRQEYRRFKLSGMDLSAWRIRANGRFLQVLGRVGFFTGAAPYYQSYDGRYALSNLDLTRVEVAEVHEARRGGSSGAEFELGFGVHKFVEVVAFIGFNMSTFEYRIHQEVMGQVSVIREPVAQLIQTTLVGGRVNVVPMASYSFRPTMGIGVSAWTGTPLAKLVDAPDYLVPIDAPTRIALQMLPGVETSAGRNINVFARLAMDVRLAGSPYVEYQDGAAALTARPMPSGAYGMGVMFQGGLQVRLGGAAGRKSSDLGPQLIYEDDDF